MERNVKSGVIYQGLFLIAFALYAEGQRRVFRSEVQTNDSIPVGVKTESRTHRPFLAKLEEDLRLIPVFQGKLEGFTLEVLDQGVLMTLESDELFRAHAISVDSSWFSTLEQIGAKVYSNPDPDALLEIEVSGEAGSPEKDLGLKRAGWIQAYFQSHFQEKKERAVRLRQGDLVPRGNRICFRIRIKST